MEDNLILGLLLSKLFIHIELVTQIVLIPTPSVTTEKNVDCVLKGKQNCR